MRVLRGFLDLEPGLAATVVSIGNFDGVHRGHQAVIGSAVCAAEASGRTSVVCTFDPHTRVFLRPEAPPRLLETLDQRLAAIEALGVDVAIVIPFTRSVAELPAVDFVRGFLRARLDAVAVHVSEGFTFGAGGAGDVDLLERLAGPEGFDLEVVRWVFYAGRPVSSTRIREALAAGRLAEAEAMLGRPFALVGEVVAGAGRGRELGAPTANLAVENGILPAAGVYVTEVGFGDRRLPSVTNVGVRPTFGEGGAMTVETHLVDREIELYGERIELIFRERLRGEKAFPDAAALRAQIAEDVGRARRWFADRDQGVGYTAGVSERVSAAPKARRER